MVTTQTRGTKTHTHRVIEREGSAPFEHHRWWSCCSAGHKPSVQVDCGRVFQLVESQEPLLFYFLTMKSRQKMYSTALKFFWQKNYKARPTCRVNNSFKLFNWIVCVLYNKSPTHLKKYNYIYVFFNRDRERESSPTHQSRCEEWVPFEPWHHQRGF